MKKILTLLALIGCSLNSFSTCIAIYIGRDGHIYVAADSRRSFIFNEDNGTRQFDTICKIHNVRDNYFAISGFDDGALLKEATTALTQNWNIDTAMRVFGNSMSLRYKHLMDEAKTYYPDKFKNFLKNGLGRVSFFGYYDGEPRVVNVNFLCGKNKAGDPIVTYKTHQVITATVIGISEDIINAKPEELPTYETMEQNPSLYVEELVKLEARKQPLAVGEPIDLLVLKPNGPVWIRKNENAASY